MRAAAFLRYAAIQFIVCAALAMLLYAGGSFTDPHAPHYDFAGNFLSDLGATTSWSGNPNRLSAALFALGLGTLGLAFIVFAHAWRGFAFAQRRAAVAGHASAVVGTLCGVAFVGVACTPIDLALAYHNVFVVTAFTLLPIYIACFTIALARNGAPPAISLASLGYLAVVIGYALLIFLGPRPDTPAGFRTQVIGQKLVALASMVHIIFLITAIRRHHHRHRPATP